jgi:hypothetical protein
MAKPLHINGCVRASTITHGTDWEPGFSLFWNPVALHGPCFQGIRSERIEGFLSLMSKSFKSEKSAEFFHQPGLEYWFKERRTLIDFQRGPLGSYVEGFAAYLKAKGYSYNGAERFLVCAATSMHS